MMSFRQGAILRAGSLLLPKDKLQAPGRPVFDKTLLDHICRLGGKGGGCGRALWQAGKMSLGDCPAIGPTVEVIMDQEKSGGIGEVGVPVELVL